MTRRGMTLIEMMVAMTATLLLMGAIAQVFSVFGSAVSDSRAVIETDTRMRAVAWRLRSDLNGVTAPTLPPVRPDMDSGYFEIVEGPSTDTKLFYDALNGVSLGSPQDQTSASPIAGTSSDDRLLGDTDDVLLFTTRNNDVPFLGKFGSGKYESPVAEVAWFLRPTRINGAPATTNPVTYTLYRRQLLVVGYVGAGPFASARNMVDSATLTGTGTPWQNFMTSYDISARGAAVAGGMTFLPNTLADLTRRESRFMHNTAGVTNGSGFPYKFPATYQNVSAPTGLTLTGTPREGEDVVLTNVLAFDVRVFDPTAVVQANGSTVLVPGDPGFVAGTSVGTGAYVDLGNDEFTTGPALLKPRFASFGDARSSLQAMAASKPRPYDTWSTHYETDGRDQDGDGIIDQGSNGLDDNGDGVVDNGDTDLNRDGAFPSRPDPSGELGELEVAPPYPFPLRGVEVRIRCYEPTSRQVRQITVRHSFVPN
jgi:prepilin-type N-terminal cleavage/methylation domain-containing protein